eukprot:Hpha_TRINITY_DN2849_c0_g1::TRINITY_DN2849_c0_g1_i1::g.171268::m.171268
MVRCTLFSTTFAAHLRGVPRLTRLLTTHFGTGATSLPMSSKSYSNSPPSTPAPPPLLPRSGDTVIPFTRTLKETSSFFRVFFQDEVHFNGFLPPPSSAQPRGCEGFVPAPLDPPLGPFPPFPLIP